MLTQEPEIIEKYVETGQALYIFWPVINHGNPSLYSSITMECVGQQDPALAWEMHGYLFEEQSALWQATRDFFVAAANAVGADQAEFEACYDGGLGMQTVLDLDSIRRERGIVAQPFFDVNGIILGGTSELIETIEQELQ